MSEFEQQEQPKGVSRRTVTKAMAWAVPAIAIAAPAPAFAASRPIIPEFEAATFCKHPGNPKYYHVLINFTNTTAADIVITLGNFTVGTTVRPANFSIANAFSTTYTVPAGQTVCLYVDAGLFPNSANGGASVTFTYPGSGGSVPVSLGTVDDSALPPCGTGADPSNPNQPILDPAHILSGQCQV